LTAPLALTQRCQALWHSGESRRALVIRCGALHWAPTRGLCAGLLHSCCISYLSANNVNM